MMVIVKMSAYRIDFLEEPSQNIYPESEHSVLDLIVVMLDVLKLL